MGRNDDEGEEKVNADEPRRDAVSGWALALARVSKDINQD